MRLANRTIILVALLILVAFMQMFPDRAGTIELVWLLLFGLCLSGWTVRRLLLQHRRQHATAAQHIADEALYRSYKTELDEIRSRHDPGRDLDDPTSLSPDYQEELNRLHDKYHDMLARKFGPR